MPMTLEQFESAAASKPLALLGGEAVLASDIQTRLAAAGLLDPPADGAFGPVSLWALGQFLRRTGQGGKTVFDREAARSLLDDTVTDAFPLNLASSFAGRIAEAMQATGHWLCRHPDCVNVVYVEGIDFDGRSNDDAPNAFNDLRLLLRVNRNGNPEIVEAWEATTEPGMYYTQIERLDPGGAARIAFGQYKAWSVGLHMAGRPSEHAALVQTAPVTVYRDLNADYERIGDRTHTGLFGINQHWGYDLPRADIGRASAGCLVGRTKAGHRAFMKLCGEDARYAANHGYRFMASVLPAEAIGTA